MSYITKEMCQVAISNLQLFHANLKSLYEEHEMEFLDDIGRRNMLMSKPQERYFANALQQHYPQTFNCGLTGQPDIIIPDLDKELECKITSPHRGGGWSLQTDYETLKRKGSLDYLYVLCDSSFEKFAVFHFINLTTEDFRSPSPGSRGKVAMRLYKSLDKCRVLYGSITDNAQINLQKIKSKLQGADSDLTAEKKKKLLKSMDYWNKNSSYSFILEPAADESNHV